MSPLWCLLLVGLALGQANAIDLGNRNGRQGIAPSKVSQNGGDPAAKELDPNRPNVTYVMIVPSTNFESVRRKYRNTINEALGAIKNGKVPGKDLNRHYALQVSACDSLCMDPSQGSFSLSLSNAPTPGHGTMLEEAGAIQTAWFPRLRNRRPREGLRISNGSDSLRTASSRHWPHPFILK